MSWWDKIERYQDVKVACVQKDCKHDCSFMHLSYLLAPAQRQSSISPLRLNWEPRHFLGLDKITRSMIKEREKPIKWPWPWLYLQTKHLIFKHLLLDGVVNVVVAIILSKHCFLQLVRSFQLLSWRGLWAFFSSTGISPNPCNVFVECFVC